MAYALKLVEGSNTGGEWTDPQDFLLGTHAKPLIDDIRLLCSAALFRDLPCGGSEENGIPITATGDIVLPSYNPFQINNVNSQLSGFTNANGATFAATIVFYLRVSSASINITPKVWRATSRGNLISAPTVATISGTAACSATNSDYSGTNQIQVITLTLPAALAYWKVGFTVAGSPAGMMQAWARAFASCCVTLP